jgi:tetratricopeptide (TPR) repeat protein
MPRAQANARKAIEIDPLLCEPYCSLAMLENAWEWNTEQCGVEFRRCLDLNPNYAMAVAKYATSYLHPVGRFEEGVKWLKRALVLDPLSPLVHADFACNLVYRGLFAQFEQEAARVLEDDPAVVKLYWFQSKSRAISGNKAGAAEAAERGLGYLPEDPTTLGMAAAVHAICWNESRAAELQGKLEFLGQIRYVPFVARAFAYDKPGGEETFFSLLDRAIEEREPLLRVLHMTACFTFHASHPNYRVVLDKVGVGQKNFSQTTPIDLSSQSLG